MIEVESLVKRYGPRTVLSGLSFSVCAGEVLAFLGPNGAGKTTTMRIITGYLTPTSGRVRIAGFDIVGDSVRARRHLGYLPELPALYGEMRLREYLDHAGRLKGLAGSTLVGRIAAVLGDCHLEGVADQLLMHLSRGYRQRAGIAQALLANPPVLVLDEPTTGLDPGQAARTRELIKRLARSRTILFSSHILSEVEQVASRVLVLARGKVQADGPVEVLARKVPATGLTLRLSEPLVDLAEELGRIDGVGEVQAVENRPGVYTIRGGPVATLPAKVLAVLGARGVGVEEISETPRPLERLFSALVGEEVAA